MSMVGFQDSSLIANNHQLTSSHGGANSKRDIMRRVLDEALISPLSSYVQLLRASSNTPSAHVDLI